MSDFQQKIQNRQKGKKKQSEQSNQNQIHIDTDGGTIPYTD